MSVNNIQHQLRKPLKIMDNDNIQITGKTKFTRRAAEYSLLYRRRNESILEELKLDSV